MKNKLKNAKLAVSNAIEALDKARDNHSNLWASIHLEKLTKYISKVKDSIESLTKHKIIYMHNITQWVNHRVYIDNVFNKHGINVHNDGSIELLKNITKKQFSVISKLADKHIERMWVFKDRLIF